MPELPEVEVVRLGVEDIVTGAHITQVVVRDVRSLKRHRGPVEDFVQTLQGSRIGGAQRRGKFLWFPLVDSNHALVCHLGMSGQVRLGDEDSDFGPHLRIACDLTTTSGATVRLGFVDQRIFGSMAIDDLVPTADGLPGGLGGDQPVVPASVSHIARDPLDPSCDDGAFTRALRGKRTEIKRALLDQTLISGIGNIYADEALWATKLHYQHPTETLSSPKARELLHAVRDVFRQALAEGGTSFDYQYLNVNGQSGYFSRSLQVYGRDGHACSRCGAIVVREPFMNRSSHRCPRCQRKPRNR
jgi:formamidopyrimidine-DNA glycosylase